jgi:hypothetical protein
MIHTHNPTKMAKDDLRYALGARVECSLGGTWKAGTVLQHYYTQPDFPPGMSVPYQVALDDGALIFARKDDDAVIRALVREPDPVPSILPQRENRAAVLRSLGGALLHVTWAAIFMQVAMYMATGQVPWTMTFIDAEMVVGGHLTPDGYGVAALTAAFAVLGLQASSPASSSEWLDRPGVTCRNGAPDIPAIALHAMLRALGQEVFYRGVLPAVTCALFPGNPNAALAGLVLSIVLYFLLHAAEHAFSAAVAGFWFSIAAHYGGYGAAIVSSLLAQLGAAALHFGRRDRTDARSDAADVTAAAGTAGEEDKAMKPEAAAADKKQQQEEEEPGMPMPPWLDPVLPAPENRQIVLRSLYASGVHVAIALVLLQVGEYMAPGGDAGGEAAGVYGAYGGAERPWLRVFGIGMASAFGVVGGLDVFSAPGSTGYLAESAAAWLNGGAHRMSRGKGKPDRMGLIQHALLTGVGHEALFRGALPRLAVKLCQSGLLPKIITANAYNYGLVASIFGYFLFHPAEYSFFASFAAAWFALAAYCGGPGAAVLANTVSQVGAASLYFHALIRSNRAQRTQAATTKGGEGTKAKNKGGKKNR